MIVIVRHIEVLIVPVSAFPLTADCFQIIK